MSSTHKTVLTTAFKMTIFHCKVGQRAISNIMTETTIKRFHFSTKFRPVLGAFTCKSPNQCLLRYKNNKRMNVVILRTAGAFPASQVKRLIICN